MTKCLRPQNCFRHFHCFGRIWKLTVFTVFTVLEESRSSLFPLFWKHLEAHFFGSIWKLTVLEASGSSLFWKNLEALCFGRIWKRAVLEESGSSLYSDGAPPLLNSKQSKIKVKQWASRFFQDSGNSEKGSCCGLLSLRHSRLDLTPLTRNRIPYTLRP